MRMMKTKGGQIQKSRLILSAMSPAETPKLGSDLIWTVLYLAACMPATLSLKRVEHLSQCTSFYAHLFYVSSAPGGESSLVGLGRPGLSVSSFALKGLDIGCGSVAYSLEVLEEAAWISRPVGLGNSVTPRAISAEVPFEHTCDHLSFQFAGCVVLEPRVGGPRDARGGTLEEGRLRQPRE